MAQLAMPLGGPGPLPYLSSALFMDPSTQYILLWAFAKGGRQDKLMLTHVLVSGGCYENLP